MDKPGAEGELKQLGYFEFHKKDVHALLIRGCDSVEPSLDFEESNEMGTTLSPSYDAVTAGIAQVQHSIRCPPASLRILRLPHLPIVYYLWSIIYRHQRSWVPDAVWPR